MIVPFSTTAPHRQATLIGLRNFTVSSGTLRLQDLLPAYWYLLADLEECELLEENAPQSVLSEDELTALRDNDEDPYWYSEEAAEDLQTLTEMLEQVANRIPGTFYFGAHPGDGSELGFWEVDQDAPPSLREMGQESMRYLIERYGFEQSRDLFNINNPPELPSAHYSPLRLEFTRGQLDALSDHLCATR